MPLTSEAQANYKRARLLRKKLREVGPPLVPKHMVSAPMLMPRWPAQIAKLKEIPEEDLKDEQKTKLSTEDALEEEVAHIRFLVFACLTCAIGGARAEAWLWMSKARGIFHHVLRVPYLFMLSISPQLAELEELVPAKVDQPEPEQEQEQEQEQGQEAQVWFCWQASPGHLSASRAARD